MKYIISVFIVFYIFSSANVYSQCTGGTNVGAITPTTSWQTINITGGSYLTFTATLGSRYTFTFCKGGGSAAWDTQITILDNTTGTAISGAYNDDNCGVGSEVVFIAPRQCHLPRIGK